MGHWTNSKAQTLSAQSGVVTIVAFDTEIAPGNQTVIQDGLYDYAYHLNLSRPSDEEGPSRVTSVLAVRRAAGSTDTIRESRTFAYIDTFSENVLSHTGRTPLSNGDEVIVRVNYGDDQAITKTRIRQSQASLTLDLVGSSPSGNFAGISFPANATAGYEYYRTDLSEKFTFNGSKWLGELRTDGAGRNGNQAENTYLRRYNGMLMTASRGIYILWNATITGLSWTKGTGAVGDIEIHRDGSSIGSVTANSTGGGGDLDIDFDGSAVLSLFWSSTLLTNNMQVTIHYRRRI